MLMGNQKTIIISLEGSIICPKPREINVKFLKIRALIIKGTELNNL